MALTRSRTPRLVALCIAFSILVVQGWRAPDANLAVYLFVNALIALALYGVALRIAKATAYNWLNGFKYGFFLLISFLPFAYVKGADYWPKNHDYLAWRHRLVLYVQHFYQWDVIPFWSTGEAWGLGAPLPVYYHKLFCWIAAGLYIALGTIKEAIVFSLVVLAAVGVAGMYRSLRLVGATSWAALLLAGAYTFQYYTVTDWFVRGAMAEYSALMLTPWLLWWCLNLIATGRFSMWLGAILGLLFYAHNVIAYYGIVAVAFAAIVHGTQTRWNRKAVVQLAKRGVLSVLLFASLVAVYLVPMALLRAHYNPGILAWDMSWTFRPIKEYFWDKNYSWHAAHLSTVSMNPLLWGFVLVLAAVFLWNVIDKKATTNFFNRNVFSFGFIAVSLVFFFLLQFEFALEFYYAVPGAGFIQFPWRLLTFIQPLIMLLLGMLLAACASVSPNRGTANWLAGFMLLAFIGSYPVNKNPSATYEWFTRDEVEVFRNDGVFGTSGEYMPNVPMQPKDAVLFFQELSKAKAHFADSENGTIEERAPENPESLLRRFVVQTDVPATVVLPIHYSGLEVVRLETPAGSTSRLQAGRTASDPRIRLDVPAGSHEIQVVLPNALNLFYVLFK